MVYKEVGGEWIGCGYVDVWEEGFFGEEKLGRRLVGWVRLSVGDEGSGGWRVSECDGT